MAIESSAAATGRSHRYQILKPLGVGGMGMVFEATDAQLGRPVALKFARPRANRAVAAKQLAREAAVMALPRGSRTCSVYDLATHEGRTCLVMERLDGQTLEARMLAGSFSTDELVDIAVQLSQALESIHQVGLVHQDIKPANIFLTTAGRVKVLDFGLATVLGEPSGGSVFGHRRARRSVMGTPNYVAPERLLRQPADFRSDLYSLGVVLYEMATGFPPFAADSNSGILMNVLEGNPVPLCALAAGRPIALEHVVKKLLARDRTQRFQSATDVTRALAGLRVRVKAPVARARKEPLTH